MFPKFTCSPAYQPQEGNVTVFQKIQNCRALFYGPFLRHGVRQIQIPRLPEQSQAETLLAELSTGNETTRQLEGIKTRIGDCRDEDGARQLLSEMRDAEEVIVIKQIRGKRLTTDLESVLADARIEAFHQSEEHLTSIPRSLETLGITIARADELPHLIAKCSCPIDSAQLREEQAALGHSLTLRIRQVHLEGELRQGFQGIGDRLRAAIDAVKDYVTTAAGGVEAAQKFPFARRHLESIDHPVVIFGHRLLDALGELPIFDHVGSRAALDFTL